MLTYDYIIIGILITLITWCCGTMGLFLSLRKMSLLGDVISHSLLPGIALAYLYEGHFSAWVFLSGGAGSTLCVFLILELLKRFTRLKLDTCLAITYITFFATGLILASVLVPDAHLDPDTIFMGQLEFASYVNPIIYQQINLGPELLWLFLGLTLMTLVFCLCFWKRWIAQLWDPHFAALFKTQGLQVFFYLMLLASLVYSFQAVGAIMMVGAMLIPAATALCLTHSVYRAILILIGLGILYPPVSIVIAAQLHQPISSTWIGMAFVLFLSIAVLKNVYKVVFS